MTLEQSHLDIPPLAVSSFRSSIRKQSKQNPCVSHLRKIYEFNERRIRALENGEDEAELKTYTIRTSNCVQRDGEKELSCRQATPSPAIDEEEESDDCGNPSECLDDVFNQESSPNQSRDEKNFKRKRRRNETQEC